MKYLKSAPLGIEGERPRAIGQLHDEYLAGLGEQDWRLGGDHLASAHGYSDILVGLHDLLDAGERQTVVLELIDVIGHLQDLFFHFLQLALEPLEVLVEVRTAVLPVLLGFEFLFVHTGVYNEYVPPTTRSPNERGSRKPSAWQIKLFNSILYKWITNS